VLTNKQETTGTISPLGMVASQSITSIHGPEKKQTRLGSKKRLQSALLKSKDVLHFAHFPGHDSTLYTPVRFNKSPELRHHYWPSF